MHPSLRALVFARVAAHLHVESLILVLKMDVSARNPELLGRLAHMETREGVNGSIRYALTNG